MFLAPQNGPEQDHLSQGSGFLAVNPTGSRTGASVGKGEVFPTQQGRGAPGVLSVPQPWPGVPICRGLEMLQGARRESCIETGA